MRLFGGLVAQESTQARQKHLFVLRSRRVCALANEATDRTLRVVLPEKLIVEQKDRISAIGSFNYSKA